MIKNYLKTALRNLWKNRTYGLLNIFGLAVGVTCAALILLWVESEVTFDHNHTKRDRLYLTYNWQTYDATTYAFSATPGPMAAAIKAEVPGVANTCRVYWGATRLISLGEKGTYELGNCVDPSFFEMFTFDFEKGSARKPFPTISSIVISEKLARKYFGDADPVGKVIQIDHQQDFTVSAVVKDQPKNSSFRYEFYVPFEAYVQTNPWLHDWGNNGTLTYVELEPTTDLAQVNQKVLGLIHRKDDKAVSTSFLYPFNKLRLYGKFTNGKPDGGRIEYVRLFTIVACFILLIACINFMNLATARSEKRAREVGMRKVMGGTKGMIIGQFIGESLVLSFLSVFIAVGLTYLALPFFNQLVEKQLTVDILAPSHLIALIAIGVVTGLLAGSYPSFYLSSFAPVAVLKGLRLKTDTGAGFVRKGLVVFQFTVSIILIVGTVIVYRQIQYVKARNLGYDKDHLIHLTLNGDGPQHFEAIRNELIASGAVENAGVSWMSVLAMYSNGGGWLWEGKDPGKDVLITQESISAEYLPTLGLPMVHGRNFRQAIATDSNNVIVNETLARMIRKDGNATGAILNREGEKARTVIGVVKDFVFNDFYKAPEPLIFYPVVDGGATNLTIRLKGGRDLHAGLATVGDVLKRTNPGYPFEYRFLDEDFNENFKAETLIGKLAGVFAVLAILISCLGLFGLAAYTAERRTKEIGIRKVLGASMQSVIQLLSRDFLQLVGISCLVAFPLAWWAAHTWLADYAYRTAIEWWVFGLAGLGAGLIALGTVSFQAIKAALSNPVKSLRTE